jgi:hypothetical protein
MQFVGRISVSVIRHFPNRTVVAPIGRRCLLLRPMRARALEKSFARQSRAKLVLDN